MNVCSAKVKYQSERRSKHGTRNRIGVAERKGRRNNLHGKSYYIVVRSLRSLPNSSSLFGHSATGRRQSTSANRRSSQTISASVSSLSPSGNSGSPALSMKAIPPGARTSVLRLHAGNCAKEEPGELGRGASVKCRSEPREPLATGG